MRALSPGAMIVFIHVWPVLKSFPEIGTPRLFASSISAGVSTARFGAPLQYGTPSMMHAHAYSIDGAMSSWLFSIAFSNAAIVLCTADGLMKISVDAHHTATSRSHLFFALKSRMSLRNCSARSRLVLPFLTFLPVQARHVFLVEHRRHRLDRRQELLERFEMPVLEHAGSLGGRVRVVGNRIPRAEHEVVELGERHELLDERRPLVRALAQPDRRHLRQRSDRLRESPANALDAGDERGCDGTESGKEYAESPSGRFDGTAWRARLLSGQGGLP